MYVYIIYRETEPDVFKIGSTGNWKRRISSLQTGSASTLIAHTLLDVSATPYTHRQVEKILHGSFRKFHLHGEWYKIPRMNLSDIPKRFGQCILHRISAKKRQIRSEQNLNESSLKENFLHYRLMVSLSDKYIYHANNVDRERFDTTYDYLTCVQSRQFSRAKQHLSKLNTLLKKYTDQSIESSINCDISRLNLLGLLNKEYSNVNISTRFDLINNRDEVDKVLTSK